MTSGRGKRNVPAIREDDPLPWEKQRGESQKGFHSFSIYRDLGPTRSLSKVMKILGETRVAGPTMVEPWSVKWRWIERADSWDRDQDRKRSSARDEAIAEARRTDTTIGSTLKLRSLQFLRGDAEAGIAAMDVSEMSPADAARFAELGSKLVDHGLGATPLDLKGAMFVSGAAVQDLARNLVMLAIERIEVGMRAVYEANGDLGPLDFAGLVARHQDAHVEDSEAQFRRTLRS